MADLASQLSRLGLDDLGPQLSQAGVQDICELAGLKDMDIRTRCGLALGPSRRVVAAATEEAAVRAAAAKARLGDESAARSAAVLAERERIAAALKDDKARRHAPSVLLARCTKCPSPARSS
jgi:hypothetical protein